MKRFLASQQGMSIIEMMVVVGIVVIFSTFVIFNFSGTNDTMELQHAQSIVSNDLRAILSYAQTGKIVAKIGTVPNAYGMVLYPGTSRYIMYANYDGNHAYDSLGGQDLVVQEIDLHTDELLQHMSIASCKTDPLTVGDPTIKPCDISVSIPKIDIFMNDELVAKNTQIFLQHSRTGNDITVTMDRISGKIDQ
ncbi:MAG TPA: prepilin-type N-terminal cleavage/methylation domain-containing protein [Patescibacteria group bacterium]|nr:prepilin-type N-terminal cleavage/methylation domain-containing protein [Patescibacteria group bacterium]